MTDLIAAVEAGGTKFRAAFYAVAPGAELGSLEPVEEVRVETEDPATTLAAVGDFLVRRPARSLGIASFGPLVVDRDSAAYGTMASTPKPGWTGAPVLDTLRDRLGVPAEIQTDVEAAAVAELRFGAGADCESVAYVTVGTGVGVGVVTGAGVVRGRDHIELGHIAVRRRPGDEFEGICPFHGDCLEGLASGPAIEARTGTSAEQLGHEHPIWDQVADELAHLACTITWAFSPDRILFSGGVGASGHLGSRLSAATIRRLAGYSVSHADDEDLVATAGLGNDAGLVGAALLATSLL